jgi:hypothetical protein
MASAVSRWIATAPAAAATVSGADPVRPGQLSRQLTRVVDMLDFLMIAYGVGFFAVAILYVLACEKM